MSFIICVCYQQLNVFLLLIKTKIVLSGYGNLFLLPPERWSTNRRKNAAKWKQHQPLIRARDPLGVNVVAAWRFSPTIINFHHNDEKSDGIGEESHVSEMITVHTTGAIRFMLCSNLSEYIWKKKELITSWRSRRTATNSLNNNPRGIKVSTL